MPHKKVYRFFGIFWMLSIVSCIEPFDATFPDFESALVIEATLTNELKQQRVFLSRTYEFEAEGAAAESNATVTISDSQGNIFAFNDIGNGTYLSDIAFAAQAGLDYELSVTTQDGKSYGSEVAQLTSETIIDEIRAERITNDFGEDGMAILVDSFDPTGSSLNYRYEYVETFKVIAPDWNSVTLVGDPEGGCGVLEEPNRTDARICYPSASSNSIILTSTKDLSEDRVSNFMVKFINRNDYKISHRYSILVRQYVQSNEAYTFFETLDEITSSENLFSQIQTGFLQGNVFSKENSNENVLGYFDIVTVDEQRIFFNYEDFYPGEPLPPYIQDCTPSSPEIANPGGCVLRPILESGTGVFVGDNISIADGEGPYLIAPRVCGDCSVLGTDEVPDFWIE